MLLHGRLLDAPHDALEHGKLTARTRDSAIQVPMAGTVGRSVKLF